LSGCAVTALIWETVGVSIGLTALLVGRAEQLVVGDVDELRANVVPTAYLGR
jgi:hypothetical protein